MSTVINNSVLPDETSSPILWRIGVRAAVAVLVGFTLIGIVFFDGIRELVHLWATKEEYSHAYLIPLISIFLVWQKKSELTRIQWNGSWLGVAVLVLGLATWVVGALSTIYMVIHYALLLTIAGLVLSFSGRKSLRFLWVPLVFLVFMVPLPVFLYRAVSAQLQLVSSELGVLVIRLFGISVFLEGNVIDLGTYKLQVVEACNGLRYLFPLASFGFLCAYLYRGPCWHRAVVFLSTIPITVFMNSLRIGIIGVTVEYYGQEMAEGFLHSFEGWAIFMACLAVLFGEIWLLAKVQRPRLSFADAFYVEIPGPIEGMDKARERTVPRQFIAALVLLLAGVVASLSISTREEAIPERADFVEFPLHLGEWEGRPEALEQIYLKALKLTDYVMVNYGRPGSPDMVNFYTAYYASQRAGESAHSPRSCIPGGGWKIEGLSRVQLAGHPANRVQIALGDNRQLVYYWFQQRGRYITSEYLVKWFLFWDSLTKNRSDGALVRLTTRVLPGEGWVDGDRRLAEFAAALGNRLSAYVPD